MASKEYYYTTQITSGELVRSDWLRRSDWWSLLPRHRPVRIACCQKNISLKMFFFENVSNVSKNFKRFKLRLHTAINRADFVSL